VKRKGHGLLCAGLCVHTESDTSMEKGGLPEKPAPDANEETDKG
jgi:hypothetical protein